ncbi:MAG: molybdopterin oxidoreductase family protein [Acidobacteriota bacterium]|nr:molybdopterin oxidoreductase family protein [Blastocatellia bacterium]MDW8413808.1 molybdopterin oxidoreductase family protein [Acidobacteriota bacterium]
MSKLQAVCPHDCPDTCSMLVTVRDGRATKIEGDPNHRFTSGFLCTKVSKYLERVYHSERVLYPQRRVGAKGEGKFVRVSWDEALDEIAYRLKRVADEYGPQAVLPYSYAGTIGLLNYASMDRRFFHRYGASLLERTICSSAGATGYKYTIGATIGYDPEAIKYARLIAIFGSNIITSNVHLWPFILRARRNGAKVICIDPYRNRTAEASDEHIFIRPGTDAALALGLMHVIVSEGLHDEDYIQRYTVGFEQLKARLQEYPPERVSAITDIPVEKIVELARSLATMQPVAIRINYGLQRHYGGGMAVRTLACIPALTGAWRYPGGGILLSTSGTFPINTQALERPDLIPPGTRTINMSRLGEALTNRFPNGKHLDPPIKCLFVYNSNPAAVAPDSSVVIEGLRREDLFTVVHEQFQTDTADYADILLPATTQLEHFDLHKSYGHLYLMLNEPVIAPLGEALPNTELFRRLAAKMGFEEDCFKDSDEELARQALSTDHPALATITLERLKAEKYVRLNLPDPYLPFAEGGFLTPSGKCEFYSEAMLKAGLDPLPTFTPPAESAISDPQKAAKYPITLLSPPAHSFLNSTFVNIRRLKEAEREPTVELSQEDAEKRCIRSGMLVRVYNARGEVLLRAVVSSRIRPGTAVAASIWWRKYARDGKNVNATTPQLLTDMGGGATFYDNLVEIEPIESE